VKRLTGAAVVALASTIALARQGYFETFEVRLHNLDVVVTDAKGKSVHGLTKDDFIVLENGIEQKVTNFSSYDSGTSKVISSGGETAAEPQFVEEKTPPRRFVFFVDEMEVQTPTRKKLLRNATALLDELREGDLAAVIRPTGLHRIAQSYTTDVAAARKSLTEAIQSCTVRGDSPGATEIRTLRAALENAPNDEEKKIAKAIYAQQALDRGRQRLAQIRALIGSMAGMEGRKVLVLVIYGISAFPGRDAYVQEDYMAMGPERMGTSWSRFIDLTPEIDDLGRTAAANGVTIYAVEPEIPYGLMEQRTSASRPSGTTHDGRSHASVSQSISTQNLYELLHYRGLTLTSLTEKTGGKWFRGEATTDDLFQQVAADLRVYYSLAYRATGENGKPRRVEVRVRNRPDLHARTRTEVIDKTPEREMADLVLASLLFPRDVNELHVTVTAGKPVRAEGKKFTIPIDVVIPFETLTFLPIEDGRYAAKLDIHYAISGIETNFTTSGHQQQNVEISEEQYNARAGTSYRFKTGVEVWRGPTRIAVGVMDPASKLAGFRTADVMAE
jgi:VWFA-related protein